jgi:hypothetical protein
MIAHKGLPPTPFRARTKAARHSFAFLLSRWLSSPNSVSMPAHSRRVTWNYANWVIQPEPKIHYRGRAKTMKHNFNSETCYEYDKIGK